MNKLDPHALVETEDELDDGPAVGLLDLLTWLGEGKRVIAAVTVVVAVLAVIYALLQPPIFTARTTLLAPGSQQPSTSAAALAALGSLGGMAGSLAGKTPDELYVNLLKSDSVQRALATKFDLYKRYQVETYEVLRKVMPQYVRVLSDKKSGVITLEVDDKEPKFAADLANAHAGEVTKLLSRLAVSEAQQRRMFFEQQLKDTKENLIKAEQSLRQVQEKSGMVVLDQQAEAIIKAVAELKARIAEREVRLKVMRTSTTAANPDVQLLNSELTALRAELTRMESSSGSVTAGGTGSIDIPVGKLPAAAIDYVRAAREVKFQETMMTSMLRQFEVAKLDEAKEGQSLQQVDVALPPDRKSKPSRALIVLAATFAALLLSSLSVVWRRYRAMVREQNPETAQAWAQLAKAWRLRG
jgi:capsule polysaccharide export protein KpsE/RkpR